jgi:hypothetical protein
MRQTPSGRRTLRHAPGRRPTPRGPSFARRGRRQFEPDSTRV